jgi:cytochrome b pre-mRNA-processing protein 3
MIQTLNRRGKRSEAADRLYALVSARAREPVFYQAYRVADSFDGRFDLLVIHAWLVLEFLRLSGQDSVAQSFVDMLFVRFDEALREQGVGDIGIGRRMKKLAGAFYGRLQVYSDSRTEESLAAAILRNVYRGDRGRVEQAAALANYVHRARTQAQDGCAKAGASAVAPIPALDVQP